MKAKEQFLWTCSLVAVFSVAVACSSGKTEKEKQAQATIYLKGQGDIKVGPYTLSWWCRPGPVPSNISGGHLATPTTLILRGAKENSERLDIEYYPVVLGSPSHAPHGAHLRGIEPGLPFPGLEVIHASAPPGDTRPVTAKGRLSRHVRVWDVIRMSDAEFRAPKRGLEGNTSPSAEWKFDANSARSDKGLPIRVVSTGSSSDSNRIEVDLSSLGRSLGAKAMSAGVVECTAGPVSRNPPSVPETWKLAISPQSPFLVESAKLREFWVRYFVDLTIDEYPFQYEFSVSPKPFKG